MKPTDEHENNTKTQQKGIEEYITAMEIKLLII